MKHPGTEPQLHGAERHCRDSKDMFPENRESVRMPKNSAADRSYKPSKREYPSVKSDRSTKIHLGLAMKELGLSTCRTTIVPSLSGDSGQECIMLCYKYVS